jgi:hypothetical protein
MPPISSAAGVCLCVLALMLMAGCAAVGGNDRPAPPAPYNLAGYSAAFKDGYGDACAAPRRRNEQRYKSDTDYGMGWNDGQSVCRGR